MATLTIHGIDENLKQEAMQILKEHGTTAKTMFIASLRKLVSNHKTGHCFCHDLELNEETRLVFEESERGENLTHCKDTNDLFTKLGLDA